MTLELLIHVEDKRKDDHNIYWVEQVDKSMTLLLLGHTDVFFTYNIIIFIFFEQLTH